MVGPPRLSGTGSIPHVAEPHFPCPSAFTPGKAPNDEVDAYVRENALGRGIVQAATACGKALVRTPPSDVCARKRRASLYGRLVQRPSATSTGNEAGERSSLDPMLNARHTLQVLGALGAKGGPHIVAVCVWGISVHTEAEVGAILASEKRSARRARAPRCRGCGEPFEYVKEI